MFRNWKTAETLTVVTLVTLTSLLLGRVAWQHGWTAAFESRGLLMLALLIPGYITLIQFFIQHDGFSGFWRYWSYLGVVVLGYAAIGSVLREFPQPSYEKELRLFDLFLGVDVYALAGAGLPRWLTETLGLGYLLYFPYCLIRSFMITTDNDEAGREHFFLGLTIAYSLGFLGYVLCPALGPRYAVSGTFPPTGPLLSAAAIALVDRLGSPWAVMPSMHVGATAYILFFDLRFHRPWFLAGLLPALLLWTATMGLGFHYLIDVLAGLAVAYVALKSGLGLPVWLPAERTQRLTALLKRLSVNP